MPILDTDSTNKNLVGIDSNLAGIDSNLDIMAKICLKRIYMSMTLATPCIATDVMHHFVLIQKIET